MPLSPKLFHLNYKINSDERGFNFKVHVSNNDVDAVRAIGDRLGARMRLLLPSTAEVFYASMSDDNRKRDGRLLPGAMGVGTFVSAGDAPPPSDYDLDRTCINIRLETALGNSVTRKWAPLPDEILHGGIPVTAIGNLITIPAVPPDPGAGASWYEEFKNFMNDLAKNTIHLVTATHVAGEVADTSAFVSAYALKGSVKKGARHFI